MTSLKLQLLAATVMSVSATAAHAQFAFPGAEIRGAGASAVADINVKVQHCIGVNNPLGNNNGTTSTVAVASYVPVTPSAANPIHNCLATDPDDNVYNAGPTPETAGTANAYNGLYVSTGSGFGRQQWRVFANQFPAAGLTNPFGAWPNVQYAYSEAPASVSDITAYDTNAKPSAGNAIQFPFYVVPVSFAYNAKYGDKAGTALNFKVTVPGKINNVVTGGLRLTKQDYCEIWNGTITNWNDNKLRTRNGNKDLRDLADTTTRWAAEGVPIRIIGRADRSGTTDLFTRALAAQCASVGGNKFAKAAESLPYDNTSAIDIRNLRPDTHYFPTSSSSRFAGTTQGLGGLVFDRVSDRFCLWSDVDAVTRQCTTAPANPNTPGLFIVADTNGGVEEAVRTEVNNAMITSASEPTVKLNGKFGYLGGDFVAPSPGRSLFSAALQKGATTAYVMPSALNANAAVGVVKPPQTTANSGFYDENDVRVVYKDLTNLAAGTEVVNRANPLHWVNVLYPPSGPTLADPANGYPVSGASNILTYTCFSDTPKRTALANMIQFTLGKLTKKNALGGDSSTTAGDQPVIGLGANTYKGPGATSLGIGPQANIAGLPAAWIGAITETFLKKSTQASNGTVLGNRNLWIQSKQPTLANQIDGNPIPADVLVNPGCAGLPGA